MEDKSFEAVMLFRRFLAEEVENVRKTLNEGEKLHTHMTEVTNRAFFRIYGEKAPIPREYIEKFLEEENSKKTGN